MPELKNLKQGCRIETARLMLRPLSTDDATERYGAWLDSTEARRFVLTSGAPHDVKSLRAYIAGKQSADDVLFLGIFDRVGGEHIGNIKFEPVNPVAGFAVMGILIGEASWRGQGVAAEAISASARWLHEALGIRTIFLGVDPANEGAVRAYRKGGFVERTTDAIAAIPGRVLTFALDIPSARQAS